MAEIYAIQRGKAGEGDPHPTADRAVEVIENLPVRIISIHKSEAIAAARLKAVYPMSLADAFAAALGKANHASVVTGDPEFETLEMNKEVRILWLPAKRKER